MERQQIKQEAIKQAIWATKSAFLVCGLGVSCWAPMVPFAKERLALNDADLGLLLLLLGLGAIIMMPVSGVISAKFGSRKVILVGALLIAAMLPLLMLTTSVFTMAVVLFFFGSGMGLIDAAMNAHGVQVQNAYGKPIMSSLHGLYSVGGLLGALGIGLLMKWGLTPMWAAIGVSIILLLIIGINYKSLFDKQTERTIIDEINTVKTETNSKAKLWFNSRVLFIGMMCFIAFLSEGAVLDWSAVFLQNNRGVSKEMSGTGYASFSVAMAVMRLFGDRIISRLNGRIVVIGGGLVAALGMALAIFTPWVATALMGFVLWGLGMANIVPIFFSEGGRLKNVPATIAIPAITTLGYAGLLTGPAMLGLISNAFTLPAAFAFCGVLLIIMAISYALNSKVEKC
ncbi:Membrane protein mosC [Arcticibacter svalbardensis MN12-7]|uniref:Membrane protein mosC n=1 Tax=Arcticibacter svalbardensis MN12-7 TaxID=1150600 RepID=R9GY33_9SPHI|nr:MFS transporter [Arcticibacter svalbardensis]EOR96573.1 Membrane protein mosC [Arcticibacter svalbardensis MN12-7]